MHLFCVFSGINYVVNASTSQYDPQYNLYQGGVPVAQEGAEMVMSTDAHQKYQEVTGAGFGAVRGVGQCTAHQSVCAKLA